MLCTEEDRHQIAGAREILLEDTPRQNKWTNNKKTLHQQNSETDLVWYLLESWTCSLQTVRQRASLVLSSSQIHAFLFFKVWVSGPVNLKSVYSLLTSKRTKFLLPQVILKTLLGRMVHAFKHSTQEAETGGFLLCIECEVSWASPNAVINEWMVC